MSMNIFDYERPHFRFNHRPIRLFESFAGIGTQAMALKRLGVEIEHIGISEIDSHAIKSYHAIHGDVKNYGDIMKIKGADLPPIDLFTWSFPCTDLSKAGKQKGLTDTRSGLGYQVLRIISEMAVKPTVLLMENVPDLLSEKFKDGWREMYNQIELMGYTNHVEILNAKNFGVAQNRERVFMVSILGDYSYTFPPWMILDKRLKDYLEDEVDEKYYLSDKMFNYIYSFDQENKTNGSKTYQVSKGNLQIDRDIAVPITTREGNTRADTSNYISIPENTIKGYALAEDGDGVYINRPHQKRGVVQKGMIQTIKTSGDDVGVVDNLRIRKLTPLECWRLMGIDDDDFYKAQSVCSNSQLYKQAGNAIVVDVLYHIFRQLI